MTLMSSPVSSPTLPAVRYLGFKRIGADRERVFAALSDPRELTRWFAEHAQVSLEPGAPFRFWGRHTPFVPRAADADQVLWRLVPGKVLAFTWTWLKSPGAVWLELADDRAGGGCAVLVVHDLFNDQTGFGTDTPCALSDLWDVGLANLREYVERGSPALRPDFTPKDQGVEMSIIVNAPPSRVFDALTTPELMNKWLAVAAEVEPRVGGRYVLGWMDPTKGPGAQMGPSRIVEMVRDRLLVFAWSCHDEPESLVRWELEAVPGGTRVTLKHPVPVREPYFGGYTGGWSKFLVALREFAGA